MLSNKKNCNCLILVIISIIIGIAFGVASYYFTIPNLVTSLWIGFGVGIFITLLLLISALIIGKRFNYCFCNTGTCLSVGSVLTVIFTAIGLGVTITITSVASAVLFGLIMTSVFLMMLSILSILICTFKCNYCKD